MRRNILLFVLVLVVSLATAPYFGAWYDKFSPQYSYGLFGIGRDNAIFVAGLPVAYVFFTVFIFGLFGIENKKKWIMWLLVPPALFWIFADIYYIYLPIILGIIAFTLAKVIRFIVFRFKHSDS